MSPAVQGILVLFVTIAVFLTGAPVAFALGAVGVAFLVIFQGTSLAACRGRVRCIRACYDFHVWSRFRCSS